MSAEFRIDYTIHRRRSGENDFVEIGFGSTPAEGSVDAALYFAESAIQNREWETSGDMPDPSEADETEWQPTEFTRDQISSILDRVPELPGGQS